MRVVPAWFCTPSNDDAEPMAADDRGDDADALAGVLQLGALLDMRLEIAAIARRVDHSRGRPANPACASASRSGVPVAIAAASSISASGSSAAERAAADERAEMAFLVGPRRDVDAAAPSVRATSSP